jgi:hypothetical protein
VSVDKLKELKGCRIKDFIEADKTLFLVVEREKKTHKKRGKYKKKKKKSLPVDDVGEG